MKLWIWFYSRDCHQYCITWSSCSFHCRFSGFVKERLLSWFCCCIDCCISRLFCFAGWLSHGVLYLCFRYSNIKERNRQLVGRDLGPTLHLLSAAEAGSVVSPLLIYLESLALKFSKAAAFYSWVRVRVNQQHLCDCNIFVSRIIRLWGWSVLGLCADKSGMVSENKITASGPCPWHTSTVYRILWFVNPLMALLLTCVCIKWISCRLFHVYAFQTEGLCSNCRCPAKHSQRGGLAWSLQRSWPWTSSCEYFHFLLFLKRVHVAWSRDFPFQVRHCKVVTTFWGCHG